MIFMLFYKQKSVWCRETTAPADPGGIENIAGRPLSFELERKAW